MRRFRTWHSSKRSLFTPSGLILRVALGVLAFLILHAMGFRRYTTVLSGTSPTGEQIVYSDMLKMVAYVITYLFATVMAPILLIAAVALTALQRKFIPSNGPAELKQWSVESDNATGVDDGAVEKTTDNQPNA